MNYYEHHLGDYIKATAHLSMLEDAAYRRLIDAYYAKESPLPADRKACHRLARAASKAERDAVDTILDEFFTLSDDGWHQPRCDEEIAKYLGRQPAAQEKRKNDKERQRRARERRKNLFEQLSGIGAHMPWNATTETLQAELSRVTSRDMSQHVTRDNTATHTPDTSTPITSTPDNIIKSISEKSSKPPPPPLAVPIGLDETAWARWVQYRRDIRKPIKPASMLAAQQKLAGFGPDQSAIVEQSIANGWQGLFEMKSIVPAQPRRSIHDERAEVIAVLTGRSSPQSGRIIDITPAHTECVDKSDF